MRRFIWHGWFLNEKTGKLEYYTMKWGGNTREYFEAIVAEHLAGLELTDLQLQRQRIDEEVKE